MQKLNSTLYNYRAQIKEACGELRGQISAHARIEVHLGRPKIVSHNCAGALLFWGVTEYDLFVNVLYIQKKSHLLT